MIIRKMTPSDVPQVAAIEAQCFSLPWSAQGFLDSIAREDTIFLVAEMDEEDRAQTMAVDQGQENTATIAGYIGMYTSCGEGEITNVAVSSEYRKQGIGNALVEAMKSAGKEKQLESILLEVRVSNERAISLYKGNGFIELGIRKNFYEQPTEDAIIMSCAL
jgi:ribosomal-protein-alanine N-acetyltransferase